MAASLVGDTTHFVIAPLWVRSQVSVPALNVVAANQRSNAYA